LSLETKWKREEVMEGESGDEGENDRRNKISDLKAVVENG